MFSWSIAIQNNKIPFSTFFLDRLHNNLSDCSCFYELRNISQYELIFGVSMTKKLYKTKISQLYFYMLIQY